MLPRNFLGDLTASYGGYLTVNSSGKSFKVYLDGNNIELVLVSNKMDVQMIESPEWQILSHNSYFPQDCVRNFSRLCFMTVLENVTKIGIDAKNM